MYTFEGAREARRTAIATLADDPDFKDVDVGVGIGLPRTFEDGNADYHIAVRVSEGGATEELVKQKVVEALHADEADIEVKVTAQPRIIPTTRRNAEADAAALAIGSLVHRQDNPTGTLGFFARIRSEVGFVSCNHVLTDPTHFTIGAPIFAPGQANSIATLRHVAALRGGSGRKAADCAFARIDQLPPNPGLLPDGKSISAIPAKVRRGLPVVKASGSAPFLKGRITACRMWRWIPYPGSADRPGFSVLFRDIFEIESTTKDDHLDEVKAFSDPGDSGSLICTDIPDEPQRQPVGLLFAETDAGGPDNSGVSYANPITRVMRAIFLDEIVV
jgi:hypothetical protein